MALVLEGDPSGLALPGFSGGKLRHGGENALQSGRAKSCCFASPTALLQSQSIPTQIPAPGSAPPADTPPNGSKSLNWFLFFLFSPSMCCRSAAWRCQPGYNLSPCSKPISKPQIQTQPSQGCSFRVGPTASKKVPNVQASARVIQAWHCWEDICTSKINSASPWDSFALCNAKALVSLQPPDFLHWCCGGRDPTCLKSSRCRIQSESPPEGRW